jgi:hypothetical protein
LHYVRSEIIIHVMHKTLLSTFSIICLLSCYIEQIFLQVVNDFYIEEEEVAIENREEFLQKIEKRVLHIVHSISQRITED